MLCDGTYNESTAVGTEVAEEDLGSMFVWIPRFAYKITSGYHGSPEGGMDVKFLIGRTDKTEDGAKVVENNATTTSNYSKFPDGYVVHPAFKDGSSTGYSSGEWKSEVLGIWVAKFQAGVKTTDKDTDKTVSSVSNYYYPVFKGRKFGYNYVSESQCYDLSLALDDASNPYGLTSSANSHLMKSSEWGAAAYLSMSQYGYSKGTITTATEKARNNLDINGTAQHPNNSGWGIYGITGYSAPGAKTGRNAQSFTSVSATLTDTVGTDSSLVSTAWTVVDSGKDSGAGTKSSTTGNIYGVFDMSCGLAEYTAAYVNNSSGTGQGSAFATGTSWGTFGILIPIVVQAFQKTDPAMMIIAISACMAGAVCGDHCSPISDTTIMSSAGAQCEHTNHVSTQIPYAVTVAVVSFITYIISGALQKAAGIGWAALPIGIILMIGTIVGIKVLGSGKEVVND